jgi:hypothetical protein
MVAKPKQKRRRSGGEQEERQQREAVIPEFHAGDTEATLHLRPELVLGFIDVRHY